MKEQALYLFYFTQNRFFDKIAGVDCMKVKIIVITRGFSSQKY